MTGSVGAKQRFDVRQGRPCPVCGGGADLPPHQGRRDYGFVHDDPRWCTCTRVESPRASAEGWAHFLGEGGCRCGATHSVPPPLPAIAPPPRAEQVDDAQRVEWARRIWRQARPLSGTPAAAYLRGRHITIAPSPPLRFARLRHLPSELVLPALVAAVTDVDGQVLGVHRTFLAPDGSGKAAVDQQRMMLGRTQRLAVHLAPAAERMAVAEGIETALSVQQATGIPTWAALSAGGIERLELPTLPLAAEVVIAADADEDGLRAANQAARRWLREGRSVRIATPPVGRDFNDLLREGAA